jgi:methylenetetrahydrofolate dehydrogenase (NADP+) / methenyltetrahydrofolate cyclohydrolase
MPLLLDGAAVAAQIRAEVAADVAAFRAQHGRAPALRVVLVGDHPASASYVRGKTRAAAEVGLDAQTIPLPDTTTEAELLALIAGLNADPDVDGILVQLPLPAAIPQRRIIEAIHPGKDVDGFHPVNAGRVVTSTGGMAPCTPAGVVELLRRYGVETAGRHVVVGRSNIVGRPMAWLLTRPPQNATVTLCHRHTHDLARVTRLADILVVAVGYPGLITADMVKQGAVVVDVGINRAEAPETARGYRIVGDVDFANVAPKTSAITPVPGGVGPMTIAMLLCNTVTAARARLDHTGAP